MKLQRINLLLAFLPLALWAETDPAGTADVANSDVVVEISEQPVPGVSAGEEIPVVTTALPVETEVVLELPGQESGGSASMADEETISVDFPDEDVRTILRNVAELFDLNLVIPDTLQGRTSIKLRNVTWRQVFEVVLEPLGYTYVEDRNIISVKSIEELTTEPVDTRVFVANYAKAADLQGSIGPLVSTEAGGRIQVDTRSNALVITERPSRMNKIQEIIERLDKPNQQVMIESKFIEVSKTDSQDIGVDWAFIDVDKSSNKLAEGTGGGFGNVGFPNSYSVDPDFVDPNTGIFTGGVFGENGNGNLLAVFSRGQFAATLSALESTQNAKLVSNPTVVVMNNQKALFQVGEDYPIRELTYNADTATVEAGELEYRFVGIELDVTPSVNAAGMITMDIKPMVSARTEGDTVTSFGGVEDQIFRTREAQTQVTIKDGYTIAIGGLSTQDQADRRDQIPFFGDLPLFGKLFQTNTDSNEATNLIIFLTAKTLNPDGTTYAEIIDPRQIEDMKLTDEDMPGYEPDFAEQERMRKLRQMREDAAERQAIAEFEAEKTRMDNQKWNDDVYDKVEETFKGTPRYQLRKSR